MARWSAVGVLGMARRGVDQPNGAFVVIDDVADPAAAGYLVLPTAPCHGRCAGVLPGRRGADAGGRGRPPTAGRRAGSPGRDGDSPARCGTTPPSRPPRPPRPTRPPTVLSAAGPST